MAADQGLPALPPEFAEMLARVLAPGQAEAAAQVIRDALALSDFGLAVFLESVAGRLEQGGGPVTAAELRALLDAVPDA